MILFWVTPQLGRGLHAILLRRSIAWALGSSSIISQALQPWC